MAMVSFRFGFQDIVEDLLSEPTALRNCLNYYVSGEGKAKLDKIRKEFHEKQFNRVVFVGIGSNYYSCYVPFYMLNSNLNSRGIFCEMHEASEFVNYMIPRKPMEKTLIIIISRTGESRIIRDIVKALESVNFDCENVWTITNSENSFLCNKCNNVLLMKAGKEVIRSSKTFIHTVLISYFLGRAMMDQTPIDSKVAQEIRDLISEIQLYENQWELNSNNLIDFLGEHFHNLYFATRGASQATALQMALTCTEYAHIYAEATTIDMFRYGPLEMVDPSFRAIIISGSRFLQNEPQHILNLVDAITSKIGQGKVIVITNNRDIASKVRANPLVFVFEHTTQNPYLAPIFELVVLQFLILLIAQKQNLTV